MGYFDGKVAIVTGGTRGLGRATALRLARGGATLALNYRRDEQSARRTLEEIRALAPRSILLQADLGEDEQVRAMVRRVGEELGRLDILIANAAATAFRPLLELKPHPLARTFNLSVGGFAAAVQETVETTQSEAKPPGRFALLRQLRRKETRRTLGLMARFLSSLGKNLPASAKSSTSKAASSPGPMKLILACRSIDVVADL